MALPLIGLGSVDAAITQFTDRTAFLAALPGGYLSTDFASLTPGDQGATSTSTAFGPGPTLLIETRNSTNTFAGDNLWVSDIGDLNTALGASTTYSDQLRFSRAGGFFAIGGDWFLGDIDDNYLSGSVVLTFSDNSTFTITSTSQTDSFRGFISDAPLTSVLLASGDPVNVPGWVTVDNLVVPEPSAALLSGIAGLGMVLRRRRI